MMAKKTKFDWNEFFIPTWKKLIAFFALFFIVRFFFDLTAEQIINYKTWGIITWIFQPFLSISVLFRSIFVWFRLLPVFAIHNVLDLIYLYFLSCIIIFVYNKIKVKK